MWYPSTVTVQPGSDPVTLAEAKAQCGILDGSRDDQVNLWLRAARAHIEGLCSIKLVTQTVVMRCDAFADLDRLPVAPIQSITSIMYLDPTGAEQMLSGSVYELRTDDLEPTIVLRAGQRWPALLSGSRITITAVAGYGGAESVPPDIALALLLLVSHASTFSRADLLLRAETVEDIGSQQFGGIVEVTGAVARAVDVLIEKYKRWPLT